MTTTLEGGREVLAGSVLDQPRKEESEVQAGGGVGNGTEE